MKYKKTTLPNGVRIVTVPAKGNPAATVFVVVEAGSSNETKEQNGLSHFLEHMVFKGTTKRPTPLDVALEFDNVGAENNAFTWLEFTGYYGKAAKKHWKKLLDIVSDMYLNPILPEPELEKERGVILQEISMKEDNPPLRVQEIFGHLMYGDTPQGRTILGLTENIKRFSRQDFIDYRTKNYTPQRTIIVVAGDVPEKEVQKEVTALFKDLKKGKRIPRSKIEIIQKKSRVLVHHKKTDQTHIILGVRGFGANDKRTLPLTMLAGIFSAGMSSRLFKKLRDDMGACYYVRASNNAYGTYGDFTISTGINNSRLEEVVRVLLNECNKMKEILVSEKELNKVKEYLISHLYMNLETTDLLAEFYGLEEALRGKMENPDEIEKKIRKITTKDIQKIAKEVFITKNLNLAIVGDVKDEAKILSYLKF